MRNFIGAAGRMFLSFLQALSGIVFLFRETLRQSVVLLSDRKKRTQARFLAQVNEIGVQSLPLTVLVAVLVGVAITVLIAFQLRDLGGFAYIPGFVAVAIFREFGPLITGVIVGGRVGAAFTARIGTMKVTEEILALETMAVNPVRYLVVQRFLGLLLSLPALTALAVFSGVFGSFLFGSLRLGITPEAYVRGTLDVLTLTDVLSGVVKSLVYAVVITLIGCYRGLVVEGGAEEVGKATMLSVVSTTLAIIVLDTFLTAAFYG